MFSGEQAKTLGLVDELGDEEHARRLAAKLADLDEDNTRPVTLGRTRKKLMGLLPGSSLGGLLPLAVMSCLFILVTIVVNVV